MNSARDRERQRADGDSESRVRCSGAWRVAQPKVLVSNVRREHGAAHQPRRKSPEMNASDRVREQPADNELRSPGEQRRADPWLTV